MGLWERLKRWVSGQNFDEAQWQEWEDILLEADLGFANVRQILADLRKKAARERWSDPASLRQALVETLSALVRTASLELSQRPTVVLLLGVNGVGKTTTLAKLGQWCLHQGKKVVFAAGDTFRAAAVDQLRVWSERLGCRLVSQGPGADPAAVIVDALQSCRSRGEDVVLADTAGRLHNKTNLVNELTKIDRVVRARLDGGDYRKVLVIDTVTGQNAVEQARVFHQAIGVDSVILAKWDSSARGGAVLSLCRELGLGIAFLGVGEKATDLLPFDPHRFAEEVVGT